MLFHLLVNSDLRYNLLYYGITTLLEKLRNLSLKRLFEIFLKFSNLIVKIEIGYESKYNVNNIM